MSLSRRTRIYGAQMGLQMEAVAFEVADAVPVATFSAALLHQRDWVEEAGGALVPGGPTQVGLRFLTSETEQIGPRRLHLHVTSTSPAGPTAHGGLSPATGRPPSRRGPAAPRTASSSSPTRAATSCA